MAEERLRHPDVVELESFLLGDLPARDTARVVGHMLKGCPACARRMEPLAAVLLRPDLVRERPVEVGSEYDFPIYKAFAAIRRYVAARTRESCEVERDRHDSPLREVPKPLPLTSKAQELRAWERCQQLLAGCRELRQMKPRTLVDIATLVVSLAERIAPGSRDPKAIANLQATALAERGNARRLADDLVCAEADLATALSRSAHGERDGRLLARILDLLASLRIDQRRFDEACQLLDWVYAIYLELGEKHEAGRALISKSNAAYYALDLDRAVHLLKQGLTLIETTKEPYLLLAVVHNLTSHLTDQGRLEEASRLLIDSRPLYLAYGGRMDWLRGRWIEGRIAFRQGNRTKAAHDLQEVREGYGEIGVPYDIALVSLELAEIWLEQGRFAEILALLDDTVAVFRARGIQRETIATLLLTWEAVERQRVSAALLRLVAKRLDELDLQTDRHTG